LRLAPRTISILLATFLVTAFPAAAAPSGSEKAGARQEESKPEGLRQLADLVVDTAYERAKNILMLVTAFGTVLIAFGAVMLRWSLSGRRTAPSPPSAPPPESA